MIYFYFALTLIALLCLAWLLTPYTEERQAVRTHLPLILGFAAVFLQLVLGKVAEAQTPDSATDILPLVQQKLETQKPVLTSNFVQTRQLTGVRRAFVEEGRMIVDRQQGVIWETVKPFLNTVRITKTEIRQSANGQLLSRLSADDEPIVGVVSNVLFAVFSGDLAILEEYFSYSGKSTGKDWELRFTPRNTGMAQVIKTLTLAGDQVVRQVTLINASGDRSEIRFTDTHFADQLAPDDAQLFR